MALPSEELGAIVSRLEDAARRLKAGAEAPASAPAPPPPSASAPAPPPPSASAPAPPPPSASASAPPSSDAPPAPRAERPAPTERRRLDEVLDGLDRANLEVRRARARLAELEARLGLDRAA